MIFGQQWQLPVERGSENGMYLLKHVMTPMLIRLSCLFFVHAKTLKKLKQAPGDAPQALSSKEPEVCP